MNIDNFKAPLNGGNATTGEKHIENILQQVSKKLNFYYVREVKIGYFRDRRRRADFCFNYKGRTFLIEFDGLQHSQPIEKFGGWYSWKDTQARDHWENNVFCPQNNICLIRYKVFCKYPEVMKQMEAQQKLIDSITPERLERDIQKAMQCRYVQNSVSYCRPRLTVSLDLDGTVLDWGKSHEKKFKCQISNLTDTQIARQVEKCRYDKQFWENLELIEKPDFEPVNYCTKRINSKTYTRNCLKKNGLPIKPIYQVIAQCSNKARYIKGRCDILIDDSYSNVKDCIEAGLPALLITREHNKHIDTPYRIKHLKYQEIADKYYQLKREGKWKQTFLIAQQNLKIFVEEKFQIANILKCLELVILD